MLTQIQDVFVKVTGITDYVLTPKTKLNDKEINLSSFTLIQLICEIEERFDIEIPNSELKKMKTVKDIIDYLNKNASIQ